MLLLGLTLAGCWRNQEPPRRFVPGEPLYEQFTTQGNRLVIQGEEGPTLKLRQRRSHTRVYDEKMRFVGQIRPAEDDQFQERLPRGHNAHVTGWVSADVAELPEAWRVERADGGWDVYHSDGSLLALWRHDENGWRMRRNYSQSTSYAVVVEEGTTALVDSAQKSILEIRGQGYEDLQILAWAIEELPPLSRAALALWAPANLDDRH